MSEQEEILNVRNQAIDSALNSNQKMYVGHKIPDICPNCGTNGDYQTLCCFKLSLRDKQIETLREALKEIKSWSPDCYCLDEESVSIVGGIVCPTCVAKEALEETEPKESK